MKKFIKLNLIFIFFVLLIGSVCQVFAAEDMEIKISSTKKEVTNLDIMLIIEITTNNVLEEGTNVAVQIMQGEESSTNTWSDLGTGTNISVLKKPYNYIVKNNRKSNSKSNKMEITR